MTYQAPVWAAEDIQRSLRSGQHPNALDSKRSVRLPVVLHRVESLVDGVNFAVKDLLRLPVTRFEHGAGVCHLRILSLLPSFLVQLGEKNGRVGFVEVER